MVRKLEVAKFRITDAGKIVNRIDSVLRFMKEKDLVRKGFLCGVANGLRLAKYLIVDEAEIFERNDVQVKDYQESEEELVQKLFDKFSK